MAIRELIKGFFRVIQKIKTFLEEMEFEKNRLHLPEINEKSLTIEENNKMTDKEKEEGNKLISKFTFYQKDYLRDWNNLMEAVEVVNSFVPVELIIFDRKCKVFIDPEKFFIKNWKNIETENIDKKKAVWEAVVLFFTFMKENLNK